MLTGISGRFIPSRPLAAQSPASLLAGICAAAIALGTKAFYSSAGATELLWILAPSSWLARVVGGIDLVYEQGAGFISHSHHLVVGPACAGVNFLVICFLGLYFSFARHFSSKWRWLLQSVLIAFAATIAANSVRIVVSAHLWNAAVYGEWISREEMHRLAGTAIYYASLLALYFAVECLIHARAHRTAPLLWYLGISLGVPLAGRMYAGAGVAPSFATHAAWVMGLALLLTLVKVLPLAVRNRLH
jgi:exosortase K